MKLVLPGGSGQVGQVIAGRFQKYGHDVVVLSRDAQPAPWRTVYWDGRSLGDWQPELEDADVVIGLAGKNVNTRYTAKNRRLIMDSRVEATHALDQAIAACQRPLRLWLQASTATISAHTFDTLMALVRFGLSGPPAGGRQYLSWVHDRDVIRILEFLIEREDIARVVNVSSPSPLPYRDFTAALRRAYGMPIGLPATRWMLEIAAFLMGTETELILKSRRVTPGRLLQAGFEFEYPEWETAAEDLVSRWRALH